MAVNRYNHDGPSIAKSCLTIIPVKQNTSLFEQHSTMAERDYKFVADGPTF